MRKLQWEEEGRGRKRQNLRKTGRGEETSERAIRKSSEEKRAEDEERGKGRQEGRKKSKAGKEARIKVCLVSMKPEEKCERK